MKGEHLWTENGSAAAPHQWLGQQSTLPAADKLGLFGFIQ